MTNITYNSLCTAIVNRYNEIYDSASYDSAPTDGVILSGSPGGYKIDAVISEEPLKAYSTSSVTAHINNIFGSKGTATIPNNEIAPVLWTTLRYLVHTFRMNSGLYIGAIPPTTAYTNSIPVDKLSGDITSIIDSLFTLMSNKIYEQSSWTHPSRTFSVSATSSSSSSSSCSSSSCSSSSSSSSSSSCSSSSCSSSCSSSSSSSCSCCSSSSSSSIFIAYFNI